MKSLLRKFLISILIVLVVINSLSGSYVLAEVGDIFTSGANLLSNFASGLIGLLTYPTTLPWVAGAIGISDIIGALARVSMGDVSNIDGSWLMDSLIITPFHILFNKIPLVDINFFDLTNCSGTIKQFREAVASWYYAMRLIAVMVLAVVLIYIGIRMALSTIASEKAMYKKMLVDWLTSLVLLFLLHYIIVFVFACNTALVNALEEIAETTDGITNIMTAIQLLCFHIDLVTRIAALLIYVMLIFQTVSFLISYIKRMFTVGFLIIIAPLITITYSMDKIGDGKAQALNTWLKEFVYNILLQPFQCILYLVFAKVAYDTMVAQAFNVFNTNNVGTSIFAILALQFIKDGEKIVKKIFGFDKASTVGDLVAGAALTKAAIDKGKDYSKKIGEGVSKTKNTIAAGKAIKNANKNSAKAANSAQRTERSAKETRDRSRQTEKNTRTAQEKTKETNNTANNTDRTVQSEHSERLRNAPDSPTLAQANAAANAARQAASATASADKKPIKGKKGTWQAIKDSGVGRAVGGLNRMLQDNKQVFAGLTMGAIGAGVGLGAGDFGNIAQAFAGANMGTGFVEGFYKNSANGVVSDTEAASQLLANTSGVTDATQQLIMAQEKGENGEIESDIKSALAQLATALKGFEKKNEALSQFRDLASQNPGALTSENVAGMLRNLEFIKPGEENTDEGKAKLEKAVAAFSNYGQAMAMSSLYNNIQHGAQIGISREGLAAMIGNRTDGGSFAPQATVGSAGPGTVTETHHETTETTEEHLPIPAEFMAQIGTILGLKALGGSVDGLDTTNRKIDELNTLIHSLQSATKEQQTQIESQLQTAGLGMNKTDDLINRLQADLNKMQREEGTEGTTNP